MRREYKQSNFPTGLIRGKYASKPIARSSPKQQKSVTRSGLRERPFTRAEAQRIRAHIRTRGLSFNVFVPEVHRELVGRKIRAGVFQDPGEAAFVAFQHLVELDRHPRIAKTLLQARLKAASEDGRSAISAEKALAKLSARLRRYARTEPAQPRPLSKARRRGLSGQSGS